MRAGEEPPPCYARASYARRSVAWRRLPVQFGSHKETVIPSKIFVGNLSYEVTRDRLSQLMGEIGDIRDVYLPVDRATGRPRGFAFVEFSDEQAAEEAIERFNEFELEGRRLRVSVAEDRRRSRPGPPSMDFDAPSGGPRFTGKPSRPKGSRRGLRGKKRSL